MTIATANPGQHDKTRIYFKKVCTGSRNIFGGILKHPQLRKLSFAVHKPFADSKLEADTHLSNSPLIGLNAEHTNSNRTLETTATPRVQLKYDENACQQQRLLGVSSLTNVRLKGASAI